MVKSTKIWGWVEFVEDGCSSIKTVTAKLILKPLYRQPAVGKRFLTCFNHRPAHVILLLRAKIPSKMGETGNILVKREDLPRFYEVLTNDNPDTIAETVRLFSAPHSLGY